jgi:hypothetical protein
MAYEIDASLVGETVTLRYNPSDQGKEIKVCHNGRFVQKAKLVDIYANCFVKRDRPSKTIEALDPEKTIDHERESRPKQPVNFSRISQVEKGDGYV